MHVLETGGVALEAGHVDGHGALAVANGIPAPPSRYMMVQ